MFWVFTADSCKSSRAVARRALGDSPQSGIVPANQTEETEVLELLGEGEVGVYKLQAYPTE